MNNSKSQVLSLIIISCIYIFIVSILFFTKIIIKLLLLNTLDLDLMLHGNTNIIR